MTLLQFIKKYDGKYLEVAGSANAINQCVDLANGYIKEVLGLPIIEWTNAKDFPSKAGDKYDFIKNTPDGIPEVGDIVVWNGRVGGGAGHIGVFLMGGVNSFKSFDQNWPVGSPCHPQPHTYTNVSGWLHPKQNDIIEDTVDSNPKIDFGGFQTILETYKVLELNTVKSKLQAKDTNIYNLDHEKFTLKHAIANKDEIVDAQGKRILALNEEREKDKAEIKRLKEGTLGFFGTLGSLIDRLIIRADDVAKRT